MVQLVNCILPRDDIDWEVLVTCRDFIEFLMDYLSGQLPAEERLVFEEHLAICPPCVAYLKTYKETVKLGKAAFAETDEPLPEEVPEALVKAILCARAKAEGERHPGNSPPSRKVP